MAYQGSIASATTLAKLIPELWSSEINDFYRSKLVAAKHFWNVSDMVQGGGDTLHIPNLAEMTANDKTNGSEVTLNANTETETVLQINTWKEVSFLIEKKEAKQVLNSIQLQEKYIRNAAYTVAKSLDTALLSLYSGLSQSVGASDAALSDSTILSAIQTVLSADVPKEELAFFFNSNQVWGDLMGIDKYVNFDYTTKRPVEGGGLASASGNLYGIPVYETNNLVTTGSGAVAHGLLAHRDAFVYADYGVELDSNWDFRYLGALSTADMIFGVAENRDAAAVEIISNN